MIQSQSWRRRYDSSHVFTLSCLHSREFEQRKTFNLPPSANYQTTTHSHIRLERAFAFQTAIGSFCHSAETIYNANDAVN